MSSNKNIGQYEWVDLTVDNAGEIKEFYSAVIGWESEDTPQGDYNDFTMSDPIEKSPRTGICHARGSNKDVPPVWMVYFNVENLDKSIETVLAKGGKLLSEAKTMSGYGRYCFIQDPAGASCALFEKI